MSNLPVVPVGGMDGLGTWELIYSGSIVEELPAISISLMDGTARRYSEVDNEYSEYDMLLVKVAGELVGNGKDYNTVYLGIGAYERTSQDMTCKVVSGQATPFTIHKFFAGDGRGGFIGLNQKGNYTATDYAYASNPKTLAVACRGSTGGSEYAPKVNISMTVKIYGFKL